MPRFKGISGLLERLKRQRHQQQPYSRRNQSATRKVSNRRSQAASTGHSLYHQNTTEPVVHFPDNIDIQIIRHGTLKIPNKKEDFHEIATSQLRTAPSIKFHQHGTLPKISSTCLKPGEKLYITAPPVTMVVDEVLKPTSSFPPKQLDNWYVSIVQVLIECKTCRYYGTALASDDFYMEDTFSPSLPLVDKITHQGSGQSPSPSDSPSYSKEGSSNADVSNVYDTEQGKEVYGQLYSQDQPAVCCDLVVDEKSKYYKDVSNKCNLLACTYYLNRVEISETFVTYVCSYQLDEKEGGNETKQVENLCTFGGVEWQFKGRVDRLKNGSYQVDKSCASEPPRPAVSEQQVLLKKALNHKTLSGFATPNDTQGRKIVLLKS